MTRAQLETAVRAWLLAAVGCGADRVIIGWPNAPRPNLTYLKVKIDAVRTVGQDDAGALDDNGVRTHYGDRIAPVSLQAYGPGALDAINRVINSVWRESINWQLQAAGIAPHIPDRALDLTGFLETDAEERAALDIDVGLKEVYTDEVGLIEHVVISGRVMQDGFEDAGAGSAPVGAAPFGGGTIFTINCTVDREPTD